MMSLLDEVQEAAIRQQHEWMRQAAWLQSSGVSAAKPKRGLCRCDEYPWVHQRNVGRCEAKRLIKAVIVCDMLEAGA